MTYYNLNQPSVALYAEYGTSPESNDAASRSDETFNRFAIKSSQQKVCSVLFSFFNNTMILINQIKLTIARSIAYGTSPNQIEVALRGNEVFSTFALNVRQQEVCLVAQCGDDLDIESYGRSRNLQGKRRTKFTLRELPHVEQLNHSRQYLTKRVLRRKLDQDLFWNDPQLQGWAYHLILRHDEASLARVLIFVFQYDEDYVRKAMKLLRIVVKSMDAKHVNKLQNVSLALDVYDWNVDHSDRKVYLKAQSGPSEIFSGVSTLMTILRFLGMSSQLMTKLSISSIIIFLYDLWNSSSLEIAFVTILKYLDKLNCKHAYLVLLGIGVAQILARLKRSKLNENVILPVAQAFTPSGNEQWYLTLLRGLRDFSTLKRAMFDFWDILKQTPIAAYLFDVHAELAKIHSDIPDWMQRVSIAYTQHGVFKAGSDFTFSLEVTELMKQGLDYQRAIQKARASPASFSSFNVVFRLCQEMAKETKAFAITAQARPEPLVIFLRGKTGQGKSVLAQTIPYDLFKRLGIDYNPAVDYYRRNETQDHWDGYNHQKVVCFDDMLQSTDPTDLKNALLDFIHLKNELPYPLKMADLASKANTWFTSPLVLITSNNDIERGPPIKSLGAIRRRRDIFCDVRIRPEFLVQGIADVRKIEQYAIATYGKYRMCPEIYAFDLYSSGTEDCEPRFLRTLNYEEMLDLAVSHWHLLHNKRSMLENYFEKDAPVSEEVKPTPKPASYFSKLHDVRNFCVKKCIIMYSDLKYRFSEISGLGAYRRFKSCTNFLSKYLPYVCAGLFCAGIATYYIVTSRAQKQAELQSSGDNGTTRARVIRHSVKSVKKAKAEMISSGDNTTRRVVGSRKLVRPKLARIAEAEGVCDPEAAVILEKVQKANQVEVRFLGSRIHGTMLTGNMLMVPAHLFKDGMEDLDAIPDDTLMNISKPGQGEFSFAYSQMDIVLDACLDVLFIKLPRECPTFPSIIHSFVKESDLGNLNVRKMCVFNIKERNGAIQIWSQPILDGKFEGTTEYTAPFSGHKSVILSITRSVRYTSATQFGDCGSLLIHYDRSQPRKLLGFHVCAYKDIGYSTIITQELIEDARKQLGVVNVQTYEFDRPSAQACFPDDLCVIMGVPGNQPRYIPNKTAIMPSPLQGDYYPPVTAPAKLTLIGRDSALVKALSTNVGKEIFFPQHLVDQAVADLMNCIMSLPSKYKQSARLLSDLETLNGVDGDEYIRPIDVSTSPGYPYVQMKHTQSGKKGFLNSSTDSDGFVRYEMGTELLQRYAEREEGLGKGFIPPTIFLDTLKDERRPLAKVESSNTRVFNVVPMDLNLLLRKYCGFFIAHLMSNHIYGEISVGLNVHSVAWKMLYHDMERVSDKFIAGDYSKYDKRLPWQLVSQVPRIISTFLGGYEDELDVLFRSTFNGMYMSRECTYFKTFGNPSGNALTTIVNSLVNCLLIRIAYLGLGQENGVNDMSRFTSHVCLKTYGDDNVMSVSDSISWFNLNSISQFLSTCGVDYGAATKDGCKYDYIPLESVTYLKRSFRKDGGNVFAPLPRSVICESPNWLRKHPDQELIMVQIIESAKKEWFHYGKKVYNEEVRKIEQLCYKLDICLPGTTYETWRTQFDLAG